MTSKKITKLFTSTYRYFEQRFSDQDLLAGLDGLDATQPDKYLKLSELKPLVSKYEKILNLNKTSLQMELYQVREAPQSYNPSNHQNVTKLLSVKNTIAASSCTPERVFSAMNRIKSPKRSTLQDERTGDLVLLSYERNITKELDLETILVQFEEMENRRVPLK